MIVYKTTNLINGKIYVGQDLHNKPKYLGSGKIFKLALKKYGKNNFKKEILEYCTSKDDLNEKEIFWIKKLNSRDRKIGYNITTGGVFGDISTHPNIDEIRKKISIANKGKKRSDKTKKLISAGLMNHKVSNITKNKISKTRKERNIRPSKNNIDATIKRLKTDLYGENNLNAKVFYLISPKGEIHKTNGTLPEFCRQNNLNVNVLRNYLNKGKVPPTNRENSKIRENTTGWELKTDLSIIGKYDKYYYELISPNDNLYTIKHGLRKFCKEYNLNYDCLILNKNKGKIKPSKICFTEERINTTGWEMIKIDPNVI